MSLTLARAEVPVGVALRLFLPERWAADQARRAKAGVPEAIPGRPKWRIALDELDRVRAAGATFGAVAADAEYGKAAEFRRGLSERGLLWAVGILPTQKVYPAAVTVAPPPVRATGRPAKHPVPSARSAGAKELFAALPATAWRTIAWRRGTKGGLSAEFAALRVRVADGRPHGRARPASTGRGGVAGVRAPARWRAAQILPDQSSRRHAAGGPDRPDQGALGVRAGAAAAEGRARARPHFEGRSWTGLHHHALLCLVALCFLQHLRRRRRGGKSRVRRPGAAARAVPAAGPAPSGRGPELLPAPLPALPSARPLPPSDYERGGVVLRARLRMAARA